MSYDGTLLVVSHDRDFLDMLTDRIFEIKEERISVHHEDVGSFLKRKKQESIALFENTGKQKKNKKKQEKPAKQEKPTLSYEEQKERKRLENKVDKLEKDIENLEKKIKEYDIKIANLDYSNETETNAVLEPYKELKATLKQKMEAWENGIMELG
jgi:ATP-binding cassette subfamily F protein 3